MLGKKLLTIGCVLGILACGACFGPVYHGPPPPAPPPLRPMEGVHTIRVTVTNASDTKHFASSRLAQSVIDQINYLSRRRNSGLHAIGSEAAKPADAILAVTILTETPYSVNRLASLGQAEWKVACKASATLTANDGRVIWSDPNLLLTEQFSLDHASDQGATFNWDAPIVKNQTLYMMGFTLVGRMIYLNSTD